MASSADGDKELFKKYIETKDIEIRNSIVEKYLYLVDILVKPFAQIVPIARFFNRKGNP